MAKTDDGLPEDSSASDRPSGGSGETPPLPGSESPAPQKAGWIEGLAQRSTGLPADVTGAPKPAREKTPWSYAGMGLQFAATIALFGYMGYALDKRMGWTPWGLISFSMVAMVGSLYLLIKDALKENVDTPPKKRPMDTERRRNDDGPGST